MTEALPIGATPFTSSILPSGTTPGTVIVGIPSALPSGACLPLTLSDPTCFASGLTVQQYENPAEVAQGYGVQVDYSTSGGVSPDYYMSLVAEQVGSSNNIAVPTAANPGGTSTRYTGSPLFIYPDDTQTYAGITYDANNFTLVFTGYFEPPQTGDYQFCFDADNEDNVYIGSTVAFPCGDPSAAPAGASPTVQSYYSFSNPNNQCATIALVAGVFYPFRQVYGNYGVPSSLVASVEYPDGTTTSDLTGYLYPASCGAST